MEARAFPIRFIEEGKMKKNRYALWVIGIGLISVLVFGHSAFGADPIQLKAVGFLPKTHPIAVMTVEWVKRVNKALEGEVSVKYLGGPEITAPREQIQALKNGIFDINFNVTSYYAPLAPELNAFQLSKWTPMGGAESGRFL
jgi:TRAP-type C4-dicarboxylate transport system substrate-binding protein